MSADDFLEEFILEVNYLCEQGINISGRHYQVSIKCFVCYTPARAFLKCTVGHTATNACERCVVQGNKEYVYTTDDGENPKKNQKQLKQQFEMEKSKLILISKIIY